VSGANAGGRDRCAESLEGMENALSVRRRWSDEHVDVAARPRRAVERERICPDGNEVDTGVGKRDQEVAEVLVEPLNRHRRPGGVCPHGTERPESANACKSEAHGPRPSRRIPRAPTSWRLARPASSSREGPRRVRRRADGGRSATKLSLLA